MLLSISYLGGTGSKSWSKSYSAL